MFHNLANHLRVPCSWRGQWRLWAQRMEKGNFPGVRRDAEGSSSLFPRAPTLTSLSSLSTIRLNGKYLSQFRPWVRGKSHFLIHLAFLLTLIPLWDQWDGSFIFSPKGSKIDQDRTVIKFTWRSHNALNWRFTPYSIFKLAVNSSVKVITWGNY